MNGESVAIERLTDLARYRECEALQRRVWGLSETDVVPLHVMVTMQRNGGLVLGAFDGRGQMIGFLVGFLGSTDDSAIRRKHCSHMMGVLSEWRGHGVGYRLKLAQRDHVLRRQGIDLVTWTYDPLESRNAALNIGKLGGVTRTYLRDVYGAMDDALNAGLPTDRLRVDWWLDSQRVIGRIDDLVSGPSLGDALDEAGGALNPAMIGTDGLARPSREVRPATGMTVVVEIPGEIGAIKAADLRLAAAWRRQTRALFERCFAAGYTVIGFSSDRLADGLRRGYYILSRDAEVNGCGSIGSS